jgi:hypothetical protein
MAVPSFTVPGGLGGAPYGNLDLQLIGGSGGSTFGGWGAIELGATGSLTIDGGTIAAAGGFGGFGGRILILANSYSNSGTFNLAGVGGGGAGVLTIVPEPSSLVLLAMALPVGACAWRRRMSR